MCFYCQDMQVFSNSDDQQRLFSPKYSNPFELLYSCKKVLHGVALKKEKNENTLAVWTFHMSIAS